MTDDEIMPAWRAGHLTVVGCDACLACDDCDAPLMPDSAEYPFGRPFNDVALCRECVERRWEPDCHGR